MGLWNASARADYNLVDPPLMDVVTVAPGGWAVVRFIANNPGAHALHCHISAHIEMGNQIYFVTAPDQLEPPPDDYPLCGDVTASAVADFEASLDSSSWYKNGDPSKNCAWVATFVPKRCCVKGFDKSRARDACRAACSSDIVC